MEFDNSFEVPLPPAEAWKVLLDIKGVAPCMPGAELTEVLDLARRGLIKAHVQRFGLDTAGDAYDALAAGTLEGRAVIVP